MENIAGSLENLFLEMLSLFNQLKAVCEQEKKCLSEIDVDALWKTNQQKKQLTAQLQTARENMFQFLEQKSLMTRLDAQTTPLADIITRLPLPAATKAGLKKQALRLNLVKKEIKCLAQENTRFVNDSLDVAKGMIGMLTGGGNRPQYSRMGTIQNHQPARSLIRAEV